MGSIRVATTSDVHELAVSVSPLPLLARYGQTASRLEQALGAALVRGDGILVYDDGKLRGFAWYLSSGTFGAGAYLKLLAVSPEAQRSGIGAALLCGYESAAFATSAHAFLLVSDFNLEAQRFYQRHGYRHVGALPAFVLPDVSELIYWKPRQPVVSQAAREFASSPDPAKPVVHSLESSGETSRETLG